MAKKFKIGDKVTVTTRGPIGWESEDWSKDIPDNTECVVTMSNSISGQGQEYIAVDKSIFEIHPDHFTLTNSNK